MPCVDLVGVAEPHRSTVTAIRRAAQRGLSTAAEAELLIDRVRTHATTSLLSIEGSCPPDAAGTVGALPISPARTV
jgi:hypothetical protein